MNKQDFLAGLRHKLSALPQDDVEERLYFYSEMIEDRMEEGLSEEEAVSAIGTVEEIATQITADIPLAKIAKEKIKKRKKRTAWEIALLALGSPVWVSLLIAAFAVILSLYVALWSVIVSLWAVFISFIGGTLGGIAIGIVSIANVNVLAGVAYIGTGIACAGFSILSFYGCKAATKGTLWLTKKFALKIKKSFIKKEEVE